jgi:extracellular factor (EF) 3-hydroxypalmitic acid methyl ester biosynthesis protein
MSQSYLSFPGLSLLGQLTTSDLDWIFENASQQQIIQGKVIVQSGAMPDAIYIVMSGLMEVRIPGMAAEIALLGPGECFAEMSFVDGNPASADVLARENTLLLVLSHVKLNEQFLQNEGFVGRFYKALAFTFSERIRNANVQFTSQYEHNLNKPAEIPELRLIESSLEKLSKLLFKADQKAIKAGGEVPEDFAKDVRKAFREFTHLFNKISGEQSPLDATLKAQIGFGAKQVMLPYMLLSRMGDRMYSKPRGYAGDFLTIEMLYSNEAVGSGRLGPLLDRCFLDQEAGQAVQNRRAFLAEEITHLLHSFHDSQLHITSMACGPAAELFDVYATLSDKSRLQSVCIDIDQQALDYVGNKLTPEIRPYVKLESANLLYLALGRCKLELPPQDLMYSIGLIDYFNDKFVLNLLNYIYAQLKPGGWCILGNFHPVNPTRAMMDYILDWKLIHRTEEDMHRLFSQSRFGKNCDKIRFEPAGVNLFAFGQKALE